MMKSWRESLEPSGPKEGRAAYLIVLGDPFADKGADDNTGCCEVFTGAYIP
jgi:hypothetical protein